MNFRPGALVVLEGLDRTGKTTQREALQAAGWDPPGPLVTHMPSGLTPLTRAIYETTERQKITSALARQLLHLACHAENLPALVHARNERGVILDRWWWSTVAYGWFGGLRDHLDEASFFGAIQMVWGGLEADVVFLFLETYEEDSHNVSAVVDGYRSLAAEHPTVAVEVPAGSEESTTRFLLEELRRRDLA
jgi:dTMP kinase